MYRQPGQRIEVTFLARDLPFLIMPVTVVEDSPERIMHFLSAGTRYQRRAAVDGSPAPRVIPPEDFETVPTHMVEEVWRGTNRLIVTRPGQAHAVFLKWRAPSWEFLGWYVNLQEPLRRTERGFETRDQFLDITVAPDRSWAWKDEDELELAVSLGRLTRDEACEIRREGERVIVDIEGGFFPFNDNLVSWRPDTGKIRSPDASA